MNINSIIWLAVAVTFGIIESLTWSLVTIWVAVGAVCAAVAAAFELGLLGQMLIFIGVSVLLLFVTRPLSVHLLAKKKEPTNVDRMVGQRTRVIQQIEPMENRGQVKVLGQIWSAVSEDGKPIEAGEEAVIVAIRGVKAVVKRAEENVYSLSETGK